jgi:hypothetical protein
LVSTQLDISKDSKDIYLWNLDNMLDLKREHTSTNGSGDSRYWVQEIVDLLSLLEGQANAVQVDLAWEGGQLIMSTDHTND